MNGRYMVNSLVLPLLLVIVSFIIGYQYATLAHMDESHCFETNHQNSDDLNILLHNGGRQKTSFLVVIIISEPSNVDRRNAIRSTWLSNLPIDVQRQILCYFVVGSIDITSSLEGTLLEESKKHGDLLILPVFDTYITLTKKVDDDSYARLPEILDELKNSNYQESLYWGKITTYVIGMDFDETRIDSLNSLSAAAAIGNCSLLQKLLSEGKEDHQDNRGWRAIHHAVVNKHTHCLSLLIHNGKTNINWKSFEEISPLHLGVKSSHLPTVETLLNVPSIDINCLNPFEGSCLHLAMGDSVKFLLQHGADVLALDEDGVTPFMMGYDIKVISLFGGVQQKLQCLKSGIITPRTLQHSLKDIQELKVPWKSMHWDACHIISIIINVYVISCDPYWKRLLSSTSSYIKTYPIPYQRDISASITIGLPGLKCANVGVDMSNSLDFLNAASSCKLIDNS
ncbi:ASB3 [Lepeophtheirus salmonis]|uniref:ASB3 n=1 Tax=Lepeophtheirus salmonis TaxID=72036 RepID=A0A7R8CDL9_LEPSM|nr:ASB3 [Lepeophtheirus salmonis]CAF2750461.1 ASB3 [Lepeophtheirus salmonis]